MTQDEAAKLLPCVRRRYVVLGGWYVAGMGAWVLLLVASVAGQRSSGAGVLAPWTALAVRFAFAPPMLGTALLAFVLVRWRSQLRRLADASDCRMCPGCCYDLSAAPGGRAPGEEVQCPECAWRGDLQLSERAWRAYLGRGSVSLEAAHEAKTDPRPSRRSADES